MDIDPFDLEIERDDDIKDHTLKVSPKTKGASHGKSQNIANTLPPTFSNPFADEAKPITQKTASKAFNNPFADEAKPITQNPTSRVFSNPFADEKQTPKPQKDNINHDLDIDHDKLERDFLNDKLRWIKRGKSETLESFKTFRFFSRSEQESLHHYYEWQGVTDAVNAFRREGEIPNPENYAEDSGYKEWIMRTDYWLSNMLDIGEIQRDTTLYSYVNDEKQFDDLKDLEKGDTYADKTYIITCESTRFFEDKYNVKMTILANKGQKGIAIDKAYGTKRLLPNYEEFILKPDTKFEIIDKRIENEDGKPTIYVIMKTLSEDDIIRNQTGKNKQVS